MIQTTRLCEQMIDHRLRKMTGLKENQFGFMSDNSTTKTIFLPRKLIRIYREKKKDLHMVLLI